MCSEKEGGSKTAVSPNVCACYSKKEGLNSTSIRGVGRDRLQSKKGATGNPQGEELIITKEGS